MNDGKTNLVYPFFAALCACLLVGGTVGILLLRSSDEPRRTHRPSGADESPGRSVSSAGTELVARAESDGPAAPQAANNEPTRRPEFAAAELRIPEPRAPASESDPAPAQRAERPPEEKPDRRIESTPDRPQTKQEKTLAIIRDFITQRLKDSTDFKILDYTQPQPAKGSNRKPATVLRAVFQAKDALGQLGVHDFLFVVQKGEVAEHAPTADFLAVEAARRAAMLQLRLNELAAEEQLRELSLADDSLVGGSSPRAVGRGGIVAPHGRRGSGVTHGGGWHLAGGSHAAGGSHVASGQAGGGGHSCVLGG